MIDKVNGIWNLKTAHMPKDAGTVFSCFSCAGGSTMGYKLAGFDVIGMCEIDPKVAKVYIKNHKPKYPFVCSIRDLIDKKDLPNELYNLDILDGSPPCTSFSMAGVRERDWSKTKKFAEGQALQRLDDLFFEFIALARKLQPKIVVAENVNGLIQGNAKGYVKEIHQQFVNAGYVLQLFKLNGANMGIAQSRGRVFFVAIRKDIFCKKITLTFKEDPVSFSSIEKLIDGIPDGYTPITSNEKGLWKKCKQGELFSSVHPKKHYFTYGKVHKNKPVRTIISGSSLFHYNIPRPLSTNEVTACSSFPMDYNWLDWPESKKKWAMGMSVPPFMMQRIALEIRKQCKDVLNG